MQTCGVVGFNNWIGEIVAVQWSSRIREYFPHGLSKELDRQVLLASSEGSNEQIEQFLELSAWIRVYEVKELLEQSIKQGLGLPFRSQDSGWYVYFQSMEDTGGTLGGLRDWEEAKERNLTYWSPLWLFLAPVRTAN